MNSPIDLWSKRGLGVILEVFIKSSNRFKKKKTKQNNHQELFLYSILKTVYLDGNYNKHIYTSVLCGFSFLSDRQAQTSVPGSSTRLLTWIDTVFCILMVTNKQVTKAQQTTWQLCYTFSCYVPYKYF